MNRKHILSLLAALAYSITVLGQMKWNQNYQNYINQYKDLAIEQMLKYRIPASITLAQGLFESGAGQIEAQTLIAKQKLDAEIGAGDFYIIEATLGETDIECGVGRFEIGSCTLNGNADISGGVGDVSIGIIGEKEDFNYELSCGMGELDVFDDSYTSLGKDKEIDNDAKYSISLDCGVGRVNVYGSGKSL